MRKRLLMVLLTMAATCINMVAGNVVDLTTERGTVGYESLAEAVAAANDNGRGVLTLQEDCNIDMETLEITCNMVLDLNRHSIYGYADKMFSVNGKNAILTLKDSHGGGVIMSESDVTSYVIYLSNYAKMTFESGIIEAYGYTEEYEKYGIRLESTCSLDIINGTILVDGVRNCYGVHVSGGKLNVKGGIISSATENKNSYAVYSTSSASVINISGGKIRARADVGYCFGLYAYGKATIDGGEITSTFNNMSGAAVYVANSSSTLVTVNDGILLTESQNGPPTCFWMAGSNSKIKLNGGYYNYEINLEKGLSDGQYVNLLPVGWGEYKAGCRYYINDLPYYNNVVRNITQGKDYAMLETALQEAVAGDTVSLTKDYTLSHDVTVKKGVVLLIPSDMANACGTGNPESKYWHIEEYAYRTLTVQDNVTLTVEGELCVNALLTSVNGGQFHGTATPYGPYALVMLGKGAEIKASGKVYCRGYIAGEGTVTMLDGSLLKEAFLMTDWRGGTRSLSVSDKMFPFNQYYVQNVEAPVTFHYGARNMTDCDMNFVHENHLTEDIAFITPHSEGLFQMREGSTIVRSYDGATDRVHYSFSGDISLGSIVMDYDGALLDSKDYHLCIPNNYSLTVLNGTLTVPHSYILTPGVLLTVSPEATVLVKPSATLFVIDRDDWGMYAGRGYVLPLEYTIANGHGNRALRWATTTDYSSAAAYGKISSAKVEVQGSLRMEGTVMTSAHGAGNVWTSGNGSIVFCQGTTPKTGVVYMVENLLTDKIELPMASLAADKGTLLGDVDGDSRVSMADANMIVNSFLGVSPAIGAAGDMDGDGSITMSDANIIVNIFLDNE